MKRNLIFIRHGKVDLPYKNHEEMPFFILNELATQKLDPLSDREFFVGKLEYFRNLFDKFKFTAIFRSPSKRCASLEEYLKSSLAISIPAQVLTELNEIYFDLEILFSNKKVDLEEINHTLFEALFKEKNGVESFSAVLKRIEKLLEAIPKSGNFLIFTHGFLMRVIEAYFKNGANNSTSFVDCFKTTSRFDYFEGFLVNENEIVTHISPKKIVG